MRRHVKPRASFPPAAAVVLLRLFYFSLPTPFVALASSFLFACIVWFLLASSYLREESVLHEASIAIHLIASQTMSCVRRLLSFFFLFGFLSFFSFPVQIIHFNSPHALLFYLDLSFL